MSAELPVFFTYALSFFILCASGAMIMICIAFYRDIFK